MNYSQSAAIFVEKFNFVYLKEDRHKYIEKQFKRACILFIIIEQERKNEQTFITSVKLTIKVLFLFLNNQMVCCYQLI